MPALYQPKTVKERVYRPPLDPPNVPSSQLSTFIILKIPILTHIRPPTHEPLTPELPNLPQVPRPPFIFLPVPHDVIIRSRNESTLCRPAQRRDLARVTPNQSRAAG